MIYLAENNQRDNRAAAHRLLRHGLAEEYGITGELSFTHGPNGKPYLKDYPHIFFNISHCRAGAACVISDCEAGIDMQEVRAFSERAARRICTGAELGQIKTAPEPERLFCKLWAVKEAHIKWCGGSVLGGIVDTEPIIDSAFIREGINYWLCCFGYGKTPRLSVVKIKKGVVLYQP